MTQERDRQPFAKWGIFSILRLGSVSLNKVEGNFFAVIPRKVLDSNRSSNYNSHLLQVIISVQLDNPHTIAKHH